MWVFAEPTATDPKTGARWCGQRALAPTMSSATSVPVGTLLSTGDVRCSIRLILWGLSSVLNPVT